MDSLISESAAEYDLTRRRQGGNHSITLVSTTPVLHLIHPYRPVGPTQDRQTGKNEIFVDILERITVLLNANGYILNSCIDGSIQMKSYLCGNPELKLALNEDIVIGKNTSGGYGCVVLDDCNFHECVDLQDFDDQSISCLRCGFLRKLKPFFSRCSVYYRFSR